MKFRAFIKILLISYFLVWDKLFVKRSYDNHGHLVLSSIKHLVILISAGLGDAVNCLHVIAKLKSQYPDKKITVFIPGNWIDLVPDDEILTSIPMPANLKQLMLFRKIVNHRSTMLLIFNYSVFSTFLYLISRPKYVIGYLHNYRITFSYNEYFRLENRGFDYRQYVHKPEDHLSLRAELCLHYFPELDKSHFDQKSLYDKSPMKYKTETPYIVFHPGADWKFRRWPIENFIGLANLLNDKFKIFILGGKEDIQRNGIFNNMLNTENLTGKTTIAETVSVISKAILFLGNDSGLSHLASYLRVPVFTLMGPNTPMRSGPKWQNGGKIFYYQFNCSPCEQQKCQYPDNSCMQQIKMDEVYNELILKIKQIN